MAVVCIAIGSIKAWQRHKRVSRMEALIMEQNQIQIEIRSLSRWTGEVADSAEVNQDAKLSSKLRVLEKERLELFALLGRQKMDDIHRRLRAKYLKERRPQETPPSPSFGVLRNEAN